MPTFRSTRKGKKCFFVMSLRLSDHRMLHNIASFRFRSDFLVFFACISYLKFVEFKEFNNTIIPFALVGYETRRYAPRWLFTISYPTGAHGIIVAYLIVARILLYLPELAGRIDRLARKCNALVLPNREFRQH